MENKKSTTKEPTNPVVETVREGAIGANIRLGQSSDGNLGHYFSLSRAWKRQGTTNWFYSDRFYARHSELLAKVATKAAKRCAELDSELDAQDAPTDSGPVSIRVGAAISSKSFHVLGVGA